MFSLFYPEEALSSSEKRQISPQEFLPVDEEDFQSVSSFVGGRGKLAEVNQVSENCHAQQLCEDQD